MIDYDALKETSDGDWFDRLTALLIGIIAVLAAALVVIQTTESLAEARGNAQARRLASELTTRIIGSSVVSDQRGINTQRGLLESMEGNARGLVALGSGDAADTLIGQAQVDAGDRLREIVTDMDAEPDASSPLDPYARAVLASTQDEMFAMLHEQNDAADAANLASTRSNRAVMGLSVVALAGVLTGLAAVVGSGRAGRALLLLAWSAALAAMGLFVVSAGVVTI